MSTRFHVPVNRFNPRRPPVLLLGGINLVRTLGLAGIPAIVASPDPDEPAFSSRYCVGRCLLPPLEQSAAAVSALISIGDRLTSALGRRIPLMYGSDDALGLVYAHRERLQRYFLFLVTARDVASALIAKDRFQRLALARGLPAPRELSWQGHGPGSVRGTARQVLVKPRIKVDWHSTALCHQLFDGDGKARIFASGAECAAHPAVGLFHEQLTFQEYIPGDDRDLWSFHGFADENSQVLASFVGRKVRTFPTLTGESAFIELAHDEELDRLGRDVAARCPLKGVFKMDFKRDARDGSWHLLEINARFNLWNYLGAMNGVNLMRTAYDYLVDGVARQVAPARTTYRWLSLQLDYKAYREMAARRELGAARWLGSILGSRNIYNLFSWEDPGPWLAFWSSRFSRRGTRAMDKLVGALRQWRSTAS